MIGGRGVAPAAAEKSRPRLISCEQRNDEFRTPSLRTNRLVFLPEKRMFSSAESGFSLQKSMTSTKSGLPARNLFLSCARRLSHHIFCGRIQPVHKRWCRGSTFPKDFPPSSPKVAHYGFSSLSRSSFQTPDAGPTTQKAPTYSPHDPVPAQMSFQTDRHWN